MDRLVAGLGVVKEDTKDKEEDPDTEEEGSVDEE